MLFDYINEGSTALTGSVLPDVTVESLIEDITIKAAPEENLLESIARINYENEYNWIKIVEATSLDELKGIVESGDIHAVNEGAIKDFFKKAKEWFMKLWEKIQQIFKNAVLWLSAKFGKNDAFYRKYKDSFHSALNTKNLENFSITGYKYEKLVDVLNGSINIEKTKVDEAEKYIKDKINKDNAKEIKDYIKDELNTDKLADTAEEFRGKVLGNLGVSNAYNNKFTDSEMKQELDEFLKGSNSKETLEIKDITKLKDQFDLLKNPKTVGNTFNKMIKNTKKEIDEAIRKINTYEKEQVKLSSDKNENKGELAGAYASAASKFVQILKDEKTIISTCHSIVLANTKAMMTQTRAIAAKIITYKEPKNESYTEGSLLGSFELI